jgi:hypothetical protein
MQKLKNQNGFSALDGFLVVVALLAIGAAGYFAYSAHHQKTTVAAKVIAKPVAASVPAVPSTTDWTTYTSKSEPALSFKYPPTWTAIATNAEGGTVGSGPSGDGLKLTSPSGSQINYMSQAGGFGGACAPGTPDVTLSAVQSLPNAGGLYYLEFQESGGTHVGVIDLTNNNNTAPVLGEDTGSCLFYPVFDSRSVASNQLMLAGSVKSADLPTAKQLLESLQY